MAVKPLTQPLYWATDPVYSTGPFIGQPQKVTPPLAYAAEGHRPGANFPTPAEYENDQQYNLTGLARWVFAGSAAGAADAHVVETNAAGRTTVHGLTVNDTVNEVAVQLTGVGVAVPAMLVTNTAGGGGIVSQIGNTNGVAMAASLGTGSGFGFYAGMSGTGLTGTGFRVDADAATAGSGMIINHAGSGVGVEVNVTGSGRGFTVVGGSGDEAIVVTGGANQGAITAVSGLNGGAAIAAQGVGSAYGIDAQGGLLSGSADAIRGTALNAGAAGVRGRSAAGAGSGAGVLAEGIGAGQIGLYATSTAGYAFLFQGDVTPPLYPIGRFVPQTVDPTSSTNTGDFTVSVQNQPRMCVAGFGYKPFLTMPTTGSALLAVANQAFNVQTTYTTAFTTILTASALASQGNGFGTVAGGNIVKIRFEGELRQVIAGADTTEVRLVDATGGGSLTICTWAGAPSTAANSGFAMAAGSTVWQRYFMVEINHTPLADGDLIIRAEMRSTVNNAAIRFAYLEVKGTF